MFSKVMANVNSSSVKKMLFNMGVSSKLSDVKRFVTELFLVFCDVCLFRRNCYHRRDNYMLF